ncbi:MAG: tetratricopeptide repeat protein [Candidatus Obscuribacter sp.]|nr:tetratricopeptide repeat protein [Candidatus Obscuribacter sp.]MBK9278646.1 tetratricopeptide repeat protein [Candidatus Obscuribacter sp.]
MTTSRQLTRTFPVRFALALSLTLGGAHVYGFDQAALVNLNNEGVKAINAQNYQLAIQKLEEAVKMDPNYKKARENLGIAYNNYGLVFQKNPTEAIKYFHRAALLDPKNPTTIGNLTSIIRAMGKDPMDYATRVALGDASRKAADFPGAIVEYREALKLKDDGALHEKLGDVLRVRDQVDEAIAEYQAAARSADSASIEVKLGQAFQTKKDLPNAIAAYGRAISMKSDDPDVQDALVAGWEAAVRDNPTAAENHIGLGQGLQYKGDFGQAEAEFRLALSLSPGKRNPVAEKLLAALPAAKAQFSIDRLINLGVEQQSQKHYDLAIQYYQKALAMVPAGDNRQRASIFMNIGTALQAKEDYKGALDSYQQCLQLDPANMGAQEGIKTATVALKDKNIGDLSKAADDLFKAQNYDGAIAKYQELLKNAPNDAGIHFNIGAAYQLKKDFDQAIAEYNLAASIDPKNKSYQDALVKVKDLKAQPIIDAALAKHKEKDYIAAVDLYTKALDIVPNNAGLVYNLASAQYAMQDYQNARRSYTRAIELDKTGQINNLYFIATIDEHNGNGNQARAEYQSYLAQAANGTYAAQAKARFEALSKNPTATIKIKSEAELAKDKDASDSYTKAVELQKNGQFDQAIALYQKALSIQGDNADFLYALGTAYQQKGDLDNAIAFYIKAQGVSPAEPLYKKAIKDANILKAGPLVKQAYDKQTGGDVAGAISLYGQAAQLDPDNGSIYMNLGVAYQATDKFQEAFDAYQKAYNLDKKGCVDCLYLMAAIDENFGRGMQAINKYNSYTQQAPSSQYAGAARERIKALSANPSATQKLATTSDVKNAQEASSAYDEAIKKQQAADYDGAIPLYQKAISLMPKESAYLYALATCYQAKGDFDNAIRTYQDAVSKAPSKDLAGYKQALASAQMAQAQPIMDEAVQKHTAGDLAAAIPLYEKSLAMFPTNAHGWTNLAGAYQSNDDFANARRCYLKAVDLDAKNESDNWYFAGLIDENYKRVPDAVSEYGKYLAAKPTGSYAADARARMQAIKLDPSKCQVLATKAQVQASTAASAAFNEAVQLQTDKKYDEAIAKYQEALKSFPNEASYYYSLGTCYQAKEDYDNAIAQYEKARNLNPKEPAYPQLIKQLKQAKAAPLVNSAIEKQTQKNDVPGAIADYEASLKIYDDATTHSYLGTAYQAQNNLQKAMSEYMRALSMDKTLVDTYYYLGTVYEGLKQPAKAVEEYQKFMRSAPAGNANTAAVKERLKLLAPAGRK